MTFTARLAIINRDEIPPGFREDFHALAERSRARHGGYITINPSLPRRPRTTGERSQNSRHWGHCSDIAEQLTTAERVYTKEQVDASLRRMAVHDGLPTYLDEMDGTEQPIHHSQMSVEQAEIVERVKQRFADAHELWLTEFDDTVKPPVSYRSVGGRSRAEMRKYLESEEENGLK